MSSVEAAVRIFRQLEAEDLRILAVVEIDLSRHRFVPERDIIRLSELPEREAKYRLERLTEFGLLYRWVGSYVGYTLNIAGYDCLALNALVKAGVLNSIGKPLGVGKESDVYDAITQSGERVAVKFHRLGRTSFRKTKRLRGYAADKRHVSWLYQSRLAAEREIEALRLVYPRGVSVPKPIGHNRHVVVMGMIEGDCLFRICSLPDPETILDEILENVRLAYVGAGVVHGDLSEYNVVITPSGHVLIIDWPQYVRADHPSAEALLKRDVSNMLKFFRRKYGVIRSLSNVLEQIKRPLPSGA
ncbi:MAG: serine/threonine-protein kinase RIO2 [Candidatus Bathyarchaeia archaeon]|nr:serine/threonine protein kinase [Candidatus Bathyarchaeota archaeon]